MRTAFGIDHGVGHERVVAGSRQHGLDEAPLSGGQPEHLRAAHARAGAQPIRSFAVGRVELSSHHMERGTAVGSSGQDPDPNPLPRADPQRIVVVLIRVPVENNQVWCPLAIALGSAVPCWSPR